MCPATIRCGSRGSTASAFSPKSPSCSAARTGTCGTADDIAFIPAQRSAEGEFLVEGLKEGSHLFDLVIDATLFGLPSGPVRLQGQAAGAVFVRNPTFAVTLAHPRTIRAGEPYDLYATVTNTSQSPANLVRVNLEPLGISGAQLLSDPVVQFETIAPGQAVTAKYRLLAQRTGEVTFSSFTGETAGGIRLTTGIDERGVALAPNAIVLPRSADHLPAALVLAAQRVLGQAFSVATAPAEALPEGVVFVRRQTVIDHGVDLALAGERIAFGESIGRAVQDLLLDWLGNDSFDAGFDQILRTHRGGSRVSVRGRGGHPGRRRSAARLPALVRGYVGRPRAASVCDCRRHRHRAADAVGPAGAGGCIGRFIQWHGAIADVRGPPGADRRRAISPGSSSPAPSRPIATRSASSPAPPGRTTSASSCPVPHQEH